MTNGRQLFILGLLQKLLFDEQLEDVLLLVRRYVATCV